MTQLQVQKVWEKLMLFQKLFAIKNHLEKLYA